MLYQSGSTQGLHKTYIPNCLAALVIFKMASSVGVTGFL